MIKFFQRFATLRWLLPDRDVKQSYHPKNKNYALFLGYVSVVLKKFLRYNILHPPSFCCHESSNKFFQRSFHPPISYTPYFNEILFNPVRYRQRLASVRGERILTASFQYLYVIVLYVRTVQKKKKKKGYVARMPEANNAFFFCPL